METLGTTDTISQTTSAGNPNRRCPIRNRWTRIALTIAAVAAGAALIFAGMAIASASTDPNLWPFWP